MPRPVPVNEDPMAAPIRRFHMRAALAVVAVMGCASGAHPPEQPALARLPNIPSTWTMGARAQAVTGAHGMVVSGSPIASQVGADILKAGGNAMDAAVAVGFALAVVHPEAGNIGGGGFMVIRLADGTVRTIDYREAAPAKATANMFVDAEGNLTEASVTGHLASGVPGSVAGMAEVERSLGKLGLARVIAPAVALARDGFEVDRFRAGSISAEADRLRRFPASRAQFLPDGAPPAVGSTLRQPDLATTLQTIADSGPAAFYHGHIADLIVAEMARGGGLIAKADLAAYKAIWRDPIVIHYRGHTIYSMPPSSSGGVTMAETLNILEGFSPIPAFGSVDQVHLFAEAMRRAFIDRNQWLGDPAFVQMPLDRLLSKNYAAQLRATINVERATPTETLAAPLSEGDQTTHYSVVDSAGNAVSVTTTLNGGYGSAVTVAGAGFVLNNEMDDFTGAPGKPNQYGLIQGEGNAIRPGKRMLSAMTPSVVLDPTGHLLMVVGTPGGPTIITSVAQLISNVVDQHMSVADAVAAPRIHHQSIPDEIYYERGGLLPSTVERLQHMGHKVVERRGYSGDIAAIERTAEGWVGVADPRHGGGAVGY
jgi:gamma-glutamyltranspeptidase/glutathione hydrolase